MKLSTNSWHYRFLYFTGVTIPDNLCPYFWKLLLTLIIMSSLTLVTGGLAILTLYSMFFGLFGFKDTYIYIVMGIVGWSITLVFIVIYIKTTRYFTKTEKPKKARKPNILVEFIKAKYHRYCPKIEWE